MQTKNDEAETHSFKMVDDGLGGRICGVYIIIVKYTDMARLIIYNL